MSEIFPKIDFKFYSNITNYNQTNDFFFLLRIYQTNESV